MRKFSLIIGVTTTASLICAALVGMEVARVLPAGHLTSDVRDAASLPKARFSLDKVADENVPGVFLYTLIAWLALVYFSGGVFAPPTPATAAIYFLSAVAFGSAVLLVLEIDNPHSKIVPVSPSTMKQAIAEITRVH